MQSMYDIIHHAQKLHLFRSIDVQFALMLAQPYEYALLLASACLSADTGIGHVCLPLNMLKPENMFEGRYPNLAMQALQLVNYPTPAIWQQLLLSSSVVSDGSCQSPLVLDNHRLYLQRMWIYECTVAKFLNKLRCPTKFEENKIKAVLDRFFPEDNSNIIGLKKNNWQKIAAAIAITSPVVFIAGSPGTGKISTVAKLLAAIIVLSKQNNLRIMMVAPTGKSANRISESFAISINNLGINDNQKKQLPKEIITIHKLLGVKFNSQHMLYNESNKLHLDIIIIYEASMIDLPMMAHLIAALPYLTKVIFIGDNFQPVEGGAVIGDLSKLIYDGYSLSRCQELNRLTGCFFYPIGSTNKYKLTDSICLLRKNNSFYHGSNISRLANTINKGDINNALAILQNSSNNNINYKFIHDEKNYKQMINDCVLSYSNYLQQVYNRDTPINILTSFNNYRLLCALREGPFGVTGLNRHIEKTLIRFRLIEYINNNHNICCYVGRPVMILKNTPSLTLYNGDIGILLLDSQNKMRVYFSDSDSRIKSVSFNRLPEHETAFAMTVHKSHGSEFNHTALILPNQILPVITRELLYTAVTSARQQLSIYCTEKVFIHAIATPTKRRSGLVERLYLSSSY